LVVALSLLLASIGQEQIFFNVYTLRDILLRDPAYVGRVPHG
jgi:hypothetical protein